jgi:hypothetical protein
MPMKVAIEIAIDLTSYLSNCHASTISRFPKIDQGHRRDTVGADFVYLLLICECFAC